MVQGVGFRPFVYHLAKQYHLAGYVNNSNDGVHIDINASAEVANEFYQQLIAKAPALATIVQHSMVPVAGQAYTHFTINDSEATGKVNLVPAPDYAMCEYCSLDLTDSSNRRYQYPFITCTQCGPRFSIINTLPYDRSNTSMHQFQMCTTCREEYDQPTDRRHYAQTNSCSTCGIDLALYSASGVQLADDTTAIIEQIVAGLRDGKIIAVKGIGGFLLLADAANENTIATLRSRKHRPSKPFAIMVPAVAAIENDVHLSIRQKDALQSVVAPIVLVEQQLALPDWCAASVAPGLSQLGIMLPYAPLLKMIAAAFKRPLIATSANVADSPVIYDNDKALQQLSDIADYIVTHNREIIAPQDDSVVKYTWLHQQKIILRRSRGLAPSYFGYSCKCNQAVFAAGALLKSTFTFTNNNNCYVSQYLGNTDSYEVQVLYHEMLQHFIQLFNQSPGIIIADKHPLYFSTGHAISLSTDLNCQLVQVQHHKAHAAAVLAENKLLDSAQPVLCVIWDGTGLGDDGNVWGGEFFVYEKNTISRRYHFDYFPMLLNDKMAQEPRIAALAICSEVWMAEDLLQSKFTASAWTLYQKILAGKNNIQCSSVGRVFDAVVSLLNLCDVQTYEGEAALKLETLAQRYFRENGYGFSESYFMQGAHLHKIPTATLFAGIITDIKKGKLADFIAAKFHYSLAQLVQIVADNLQLQHIAFSGGVFQNAVLVDLLQQHMAQTHQLYFHQQLSPNDENISFGQMVYYDHDIDGSRFGGGNDRIVADHNTAISTALNTF